MPLLGPVGAIYLKCLDLPQGNRSPVPRVLAPAVQPAAAPTPPAAVLTPRRCVHASKCLTNQERLLPPVLIDSINGVKEDLGQSDAKNLFRA